MSMTVDPLVPLSPDFLQRVASGDAPQYAIVHKFGAALDVGTSLTVVATAKTYATPTTAQSLEIVSDDNINDIAAGTGAREVTVIGLDANWEEQTATVALNGTTAVAITGTWMRVYRMYVSATGTYATAAAASHASTITVRIAGAGAAWASIVPTGTFGHGQSQIAAYTIAAGKQAYILGYHITVQATKSADVLMFARDNADDVATPYSGVMRLQDVERAVEGTSVNQYDAPRGPYVGPCDIGFLAAANAGTASLEVNFTLLEEDV